jgi:hypothetical protein
MQDPFLHEVVPKHGIGEESPFNVNDTAGNGRSCTIPKKPNDYVYT